MKSVEVSGDGYITWSYPEIYEKEKLSVLEIALEHTRASDGIRIKYESGRDGWIIEQASTFEWDENDAVHDPGWKEVAFIQSWAREKKELISKETIILRGGMVTDAQGDSFSLDSLKEFDGKEVPCCISFDRDKCVGEMKLSYKEDVGLVGVLVATNKELFERLQKVPLFPAIVGEVLSAVDLGEGKKGITNFKLMEIGLCGIPNVDLTIKPIEFESKGK